MLELGTLWDLIEARAATSPVAQLAVDERGRTLTFSGLRDHALRAAAGLHAHGIGEGTVVSWQLPTWLESLVLMSALARLGAVQNPILPIYREREVGFITRQAGSRFFICPTVWKGFDFQTMASGLTIPDLEIITCDGMLPDGDPGTLPAPAATPGSAEDYPIRWIFYSSGTTADPKGAQHTDATIGVTAAGMCARLDYGPTDRNSLFFPLTHVAGPIWLASSLLSGGGHILMESFDPVGAIAVLQRNDVTMAGSGTIFHLAYLKAQREQPKAPLFPLVRNCPGGGAPKPPQLHYDIKAELGGRGVLSGWGLTEAPILTMGTYDDPDNRLAETEGRPMPGVSLRVVTLEGRLAEPGEEGELRAKAPQMMRGYVDPTLSEHAFDDEGWFRTGDLGTLDSDGFVTITGRLKDVIIRKGENISAKEIEDLLFTHPAVADVAVIGLPDLEVGERACAVVASAPGSGPLTFEEMVAFLKDKGLMVQKLPERLELLDALPRNPAGKVQKQDLRALFG